MQGVKVKSRQKMKVQIPEKPREVQWQSILCHFPSCCCAVRAPHPPRLHGRIDCFTYVAPPSLNMNPVSSGRRCQFRLTRTSRQCRMTSVCDWVPRPARTRVSPPHKHNSVRSPEGVGGANGGHLSSRISGVDLRCCSSAGGGQALTACGRLAGFKTGSRWFACQFYIITHATRVHTHG